MMTMTRLAWWPLATLTTLCVPLACGGQSSRLPPAGTGGVLASGGHVSTGGMTGSGGTSIATGGSTIAPPGTGGGGAGGTSSTGSTVSPPCPGTAGPAMVRLPAGFCIDSTEVTRAQYTAWLAKSPALDGQPDDCGTNTSFVPDAKCMGTVLDPKYVCLQDCDDHPQVCIDWCDAYAYCKAAGKRLCGKLGGGPSTPDDYDDPSVSQWHNACTSQGAHLYPYGDTYDPVACNGLELWPKSPPTYKYKTVPVGSMATCQSTVAGYAGVFDLSGSVEEYEDSCATDGEMEGWCNIRGGAFASSSHLACSSGAMMTRTIHDATIGFRCCSP